MAEVAQNEVQAYVLYTQLCFVAKCVLHGYMWEGTVQVNENEK